MILECDIGNTRCKWRLLQNGKVERSGSFSHEGGFGELNQLCDVNRVRVASVASATIVDNFTAQLALLHLTPEFAVSTVTAAGVSNAYHDPGKLGVDRWLAVVAAYNLLNGAALIVDAGSALTLDLVDSGGCHQGGYIAPGFELMKSSLLAGTGKVRFVAGVPANGVEFGTTTLDAVNAGVLASGLGAITVATTVAKNQLKQDIPVLLTGGDAHIIAMHLAEQGHRELMVLPDLVLDGLRWVLP